MIKEKYEMFIPGEIMREKIIETIKKQNGVLFAKPTVVYRENYSGRDILAKNSKFEAGFTDGRGYVPVERWIMSMTEAENPKPKKGEGLTSIKLIDGDILLKEAVLHAEKEIMGEFMKQWPLTKILDIGGEEKLTSFGSKEVPPIPPHVHSGNIIGGKPSKPGKSEAYFFPPVNVPPYNKTLHNVKTRLGLKKGITKEKVIETLKHFGKDDSMYELLQEYEAKPCSGWTIPEGIIHAPGPWPTFEIQLPQDDFNLAGWRLGDRTENPKDYDDLVLRGIQDETSFVDLLIDWESSSDIDFQKRFQRPIQIIDEGLWGKRFRIFFDMFYGEGWEIKSKVSFPSKHKPIAGIVWSGKGMLNGSTISQEENNEFLIVPDNTLSLEGDASSPLLIFTVEPYEEISRWKKI